MKLMQSASKLLPKAKFLLNKHAPEIWLGAGIVCIVGGTIWACKASRELDDILDTHQDEIDAIKSEREDSIEEEKRIAAAENEDEAKPRFELFSEKEYKHECLMTTLTTAKMLAREYAPAVILVTGGIGMIVNGHYILTKRNSALMAAYSVLDQTFTEYRARVAKRYGEDTERDIYEGREYDVVSTTEVDENGKKHKKNEQVVVSRSPLSRYARVWDSSTSKEWMNSPDYNHTFLICQQNSANNKLQRDGYLFLNTVYRMLGLDETPTGAICGWLMPKDGEDGVGDGYVDFGMLEGADADNAVFLDFNCQGIIYDKI